VPKIEILTGASTGKSFDIIDEIQVGRNPDLAIRLAEDVISRIHAKIYMRGADVMIEDLRSANGTFVNGQAISEPTKVNALDVIHFGNVTAKIISDAEISASPAKTLINISPAGASETSSVLRQIDADKFDVDKKTHALESAEAVVILQKHMHSMNEITRAMAETLELKTVLDKTLDSLFEIFPQAGHGFVVLEVKGEEGSLEPIAQKTRSKKGIPRSINLSRTVVDLVMKNRKSVLCQDATLDDRFKGRQSIVDMNIRSMMATPILYQDRLLGFLQLDSSDMANPFNNEALELLTTIGHQVAMFISNAQMHESLLARSRLEQDLKFARSVQHNFLPKKFPRHPNYTFTAHYKSAYDVGGDFYDFIVHNGDDDNDTLPKIVDVVIGDVTGKGVSAALMMARLVGDIRSLAIRSDTTAQLMRRINRVMNESAVEGRFVTLLIMRLNTETGEISFTNAGHNPPAIKKLNGEVIFDDEEGEFPVGVVDDHEFRQETITLERGDIVVLTTDGVIEAMNAAGECYETNRFLDVMRNGPNAVEALQEEILLDIGKFVGTAKQSDDLTIVTFGMHGDDNEVEREREPLAVGAPGGGEELKLL